MIIEGKRKGKTHKRDKAKNEREGNEEEEVLIENSG